MLPNRTRGLALALAAALAGCGGDGVAGPTVLTISAAASLQDALSEIARNFEAENPGVRLRLNFAASGTLLQQIRQGAPVDLFISAAEAQVDALEAEGMVAPETRRAFAGNELVLVVPAGGDSRVTGFADLAAPGVERVAMGAPASVPAGRYAEEVLRSLGLAEAVLPRALLGQHVRQVLTYVERGEVDAGIVYRTDAAGEERVHIVAAAPAGSHAPVTYPLAVLTGSEHPAAARALADYLLGARAQGVLHRFGFLPPPTGAPSGR